MKKTIGFMSVMAGFCLMVAGCDGPGGVVTPVTNDSILGRWFTRSMGLHGTTHYEVKTGPEAGVVDKVINTDTTYTGTTFFLELKAGGTALDAFKTSTKAAGVDSSTATWKLEGKILTLTWDASHTVEIDTLSITDGALRLANYTYSVTHPANATFIYDMRTTLTYSK